MDQSSLKLVGTSEELPLRLLELDPDNPRLVSNFGPSDQEDLAITLAMGHDAIVVAESIARHGYFANEPLIVLPPGTNGKHRIVEGNRRFVALMGLADSQVRSSFYDAERWQVLAQQREIDLDSSVPVIVVGTREEASSIMGFRHISGILDWSPYAQAAFVVDLVDEQGYAFEQVAPMIGRKKSDVAEMYRNFSIANQAQEFGIDSTALEDAFSLLTVAMGSPAIREFVGAPSGAKMVPGVAPIPEAKSSELGEVITWIFGDGTPNSRKVEESRKISALGKVIGNEVGLEALRSGDSLEEAQLAIADKGMDPGERIMKRLEAAVNALRAASEDMDTCGDDPRVAQLLADVSEELNGLFAFVETDD